MKKYSIVDENVALKLIDSLPQDFTWFAMVVVVL